MNESLIKNWNSVVSNDDKIFLVGDAFLRGYDDPKKIVHRLNGYKVLIRGNHDQPKRRMLEAGFDEYHRLVKYDMPDGRKALVQHHPIPESLFDKFDILIHGHVHDAEKVRGGRLNVSSDIWDYTPVSIDEILKIDIKKEDDDSKWCDAYVSGNMVRSHIAVHIHDFSGVIEHIYSTISNAQGGKNK
ncbi:hypothetical protein CMI47_18935 [Candidatus Pacearchaeota archaeon]|nr:hypothetical protein [Candidatus Pacearchaeota archaeon]|tara:strand:- start:19978 stop:20538 length:561 start_codon:yes stop_codon:yes gene_type:complete